MTNETIIVDTPEHNTPAVASFTPVAPLPGGKPVADSNTTKAVRVLESDYFITLDNTQ